MDHDRSRGPQAPESDAFAYSRPSDNTVPPLEVRAAVPRPVEGDDPDTQIPGRLVGQLGFEPGSRMAVEVEPGCSLRVAELGATQPSSVAERQRGIDERLSRDLSCGTISTGC